MKAYVIVSGLIFALVFIAHLARIVAEGTSTLQPIFVVSTLIALALSVWSLRVLRSLQDRPV